jgi:hypothetical protein
MLKTKPGLFEWLKWLSICLASVRPLVQTAELPKKKKKFRNMDKKIFGLEA